MRGQRGNTIVELLVATTIGLGVVLAAVQLLKTHAAIALQVQADLDANSVAAWALRSALRDVKRAGADPQRRNIEALVEATPERFATLQDLDGDGAVEPGSEESVGVAWNGRDGGRLVRRVGAQSMSVLSGVPAGGLRLLYFDERGREIPAMAGLTESERRRVRRVEVALDVLGELGTVASRAGVRGAASVRVREGRP